MGARWIGNAKSVRSLVSKLLRGQILHGEKYGWRDMRDHVRAAITVPTAADVRRVVAELADRADFDVALKLSEPAPFGYRGIMVGTTFADSGVNAEVQIHVGDAGWQLKLDSDEYYRTWRGVTKQQLQSDPALRRRFLGEKRLWRRRWHDYWQAVLKPAGMSFQNMEGWINSAIAARKAATPGAAISLAASASEISVLSKYAPTRRPGSYQARLTGSQAISSSVSSSRPWASTAYLPSSAGMAAPRLPQQILAETAGKIKEKPGAPELAPEDWALADAARLDELRSRQSRLRSAWRAHPSARKRTELEELARRIRAAEQAAPLGEPLWHDRPPTREVDLFGNVVEQRPAQGGLFDRRELEAAKLPERVKERRAVEIRDGLRAMVASVLRDMRGRRIPQPKAVRARLIERYGSAAVQDQMSGRLHGLDWEPEIAEAIDQAERGMSLFGPAAAAAEAPAGPGGRALSREKLRTLATLEQEQVEAGELLLEPAEFAFLTGLDELGDQFGDTVEAGAFALAAGLDRKSRGHMRPARRPGLRSSATHR